MNAESKINVHYSSLVGLKAELLRKQTEVKEVKAKLENAKIISKLKSKSNKPSNKKIKKELNETEDENKTEDIEDMPALKKSRLMLEAKSRLYDKLTKTHANVNPNFLVDFEHKSDSDHSENEEQEKSCQHESDNDSDSEWVEYTDCFGRTRKCLREDLPSMKKNDEILRKTVVEKPCESVTEKKLFVEDKMPTKESDVEMRRKKWEEQTAKLANKNDIHYQDILFDEARTHGVGYYAFSQDEEERAKQQENLLKLRKETEQKQKENKEAQEMKERILQNRLKIAKMRKRIRAGLPPEDPEEDAADNSIKSDANKEQEIANNSDKEIDSEKDDKTSNDTEVDKQEEAKRKMQDIENKIEAFGELLGKSNRWYVMSQEEWVQKKRKERPAEFAPKYNNFQYAGSVDFKKSSSKSNFHSSDSEDSDTIGPTLSSSSKTVIDTNDSAKCSNNDIGPLPPSPSEIDVIGPLTPPSIKSTSNSEGKTSTVNKNIEDQIEAGLKFLRQKFESKQT